MNNPIPSPRTRKTIKFHFSRILIYLSITGIIIAGSAATIYLNIDAKKYIQNESEAYVLPLTIYMNSEIQKAEGTAKAASISATIIKVLESDAPSVMENAYIRLDQFNSAFGTSVIMILDKTGLAVASTNRNSPDSFVGHNYSFRPYFQDAISGAFGKYFAMGSTSKTRGFYASSPIMNKTGEIIGVSVVKQDLEQIEELLKNYGTSFIVSPDGIIFLSSNPQYVFQSLKKLSKKKIEEINNSKQFGESKFTPIFDEIPSNNQIVQVGARKYSFHRRLIGNTDWSVALLTPAEMIFTNTLFGILFTLLLLAIGITYFSILYLKEKANIAMRESEERFEQISRNSKDWMWETDANNNIIYSNNAVADVLGYLPYELVNKTFTDFLSYESKEKISGRLRNLLTKREQYNNLISQNVTKSGNIVYLESSALPFFDTNGRFLGYRGVSRDVTENIQHEEEITKALENTKYMLESLPVCIVLVDTNKHIRWANHAALTLLGYDSEKDVIGKLCQKFICPAEESQCSVLDKHQDINKAERDVLTKRGARIPVLKTVIPIKLNNDDLLLEAFIDISDHKRAEENNASLQSTLLKTEKLAAIGRLAGGLAHELNKPLNDLFNNVINLLSKTDDSMITDELHKAESDLLVCKNIVHSLLVLSHGESLELSDIDLQQVLDKALAMCFKHISSANVKIHKESRQTKDNQSKLTGDTHQIQRAFMHIITNALEAMPDGGELTLITNKNDSFVEISIADTGKGIPKAVMDMIFDPFFTTKEQGKGYGLGLSIAKNIIERHGGKIEATSHGGKGSIFKVTLPTNIYSVNS